MHWNSPAICLIICFTCYGIICFYYCRSYVYDMLLGFIVDVFNNWNITMPVFYLKGLIWFKLYDIILPTPYYIYIHIYICLHTCSVEYKHVNNKVNSVCLVTFASGMRCVFLRRRVIRLQWEESCGCAAHTERRCDAVEHRSCARGLRTQQLGLGGLARAR